MRTFLKIVFIVVVAAVIIGTGIAIFNAGMVQGAAMSGQLSDGATPCRSTIGLGPWGFPGLWLFRHPGIVPALPLDRRSGADGLWSASRLAAWSVGLAVQRRSSSAAS